MGEALCMVQHLEGAISCSITLKNDVRHTNNVSKEEANRILENYRSVPLGKALRIAKQKMLYSHTLQNELDALLKERNWLVHKCIIYNLDDMFIPSSKEKLFQRIKMVSNEAKRLQYAIEDDLIEYSESIGMDMSMVRAEINQVLDEAFYN